MNQRPPKVCRETAYIALGGNVGTLSQLVGRLRQAIDLIRDIPGVKVVRRSSVYRTPAWGLTDQPDFLNAVVEICTDREPLHLLRELKAIEEQLGRQKRERWGPREIDLDIILFGDRIVEQDELTIPHPGLLQRAFVLLPLLEIAPGVHLPDGHAVSDETAHVVNAAHGISRIEQQL